MRQENLLICLGCLTNERGVFIINTPRSFVKARVVEIGSVSFRYNWFDGLDR
jgi:hypothetical protein